MINLSELKQWDIVEVLPESRWHSSYAGRWFRVCSIDSGRFNTKNAGSQFTMRPEDAKKVGRLDTFNMKKQPKPRPGDWIYVKSNGMGEVISCDGANVKWKMNPAYSYSYNREPKVNSVTEVTRIFRRSVHDACSFEL